MKTTSPNLDFEVDLWEKGYTVIGIDEVGRGAFAGPVYVGGVIFNPQSSKYQIKKLLSYGIDDSKRLKPLARKSLAKIIQKECLYYHISSIDVAKINQIGVGRAAFCAMRDVIKNLILKLDSQKKFVLVDGFYIKYLKGIGLKNQKGIIHGDSISLSIAAASIIAKVERDEHMKSLSAKFPLYHWGRNKGYGTLFHRRVLQEHGPTVLHRKDFIRKDFIKKHLQF